MTFEQLEELLKHIEERKSQFGLDLMPISSAAVASLTRRVLTADRAVKLLDQITDRDDVIVLLSLPDIAKVDAALTAYREASK